MNKKLYPQSIACFSLLFFFALILVFSIFLPSVLTAQEPNFAYPPLQNPFGLFVEDPTEGSFVDLVDFDHDDTLEALISSPDGVNLFENIGSNVDPNFIYVETNPFGINFSNRRPWQFIDIDGDGLDELFLFGFLIDEPIRMAENIGNPSTPIYGIPESNPYGLYLPSSNSDLLDAVVPTFADIDGDGDYDLFLGGRFQNNNNEALYFARNIDPTSDHTAPQFDAYEINPFGFNFPSNSELHWEIFEDLDCDGDLDMYFIATPSEYYYFENTGTSTNPDFSKEGILSDFGLVGSFNPPIGDFLDIGDDGDMDLITGSESSGVWLFENVSYAETVGFSYSNNGTTFNFTSTCSDDPIQWHWDFGDGNFSDEEDPEHTYAESDTYEVCLTAGAGMDCQQTFCDVVEVTVSTSELYLDATLRIYPNPATDVITFEVDSHEMIGELEIEIFNSIGVKIYSFIGRTSNATFQQSIPINYLHSGIYLLKLKSSEKFVASNFLKM